MKHRDLGPLGAKHRPGCLSAHEYSYIEGNPCSHRWHAARRARADTRIQYINANAVAKQHWYRTKAQTKKLEGWVKQGKAANVVARGGKLRFTLASFTTEWWPWMNQAHHIIPSSTFNHVLEQIASKAEPRHAQAEDVIRHGLLEEPYNINDEPNVMMLPVLDADAVAMGLPRHMLGTGRGTADHPDYREAVRRELIKRVEPRYRALIQAIKRKKHPRRPKAPVLRAVLEALSIETYEEILGKTAARREAGATDLCLDSIAFLLYR
ncbi:MAG: AHH domain-containing protein [Myxococcales bacterium]|nr:AHH domain-containing protein [Myxococcales bacterium]